MGYDVIIPIAAFLVAVKLATQVKVHTAIPASVAVFVPYLATLAVKYVYIVNYKLPVLTSLFAWSTIATVAIQFLICLVVFRQIREDDRFGAVVAWAVVGMIATLLMVPFLIKLIPIS